MQYCQALLPSETFKYYPSGNPRGQEYGLYGIDFASNLAYKPQPRPIDRASPAADGSTGREAARGPARDPLEVDT